MNSSTSTQANRKLKTKSKLLDAFEILMLEKGYDDVSIKDIVEKSGLGRGTFYFYFSSKQQIIWELLEERVLKDIEDYLKSKYEKGSISKEHKWKYIFGIINTNREILDQIVNKSHISIYQRIIDYIQVLSINDIENGRSKSKIRLSNEFLSQYFAGALMNIISKWLSDNSDKTIEDISNSFFDLNRKIFE